MNAQLAFKFIEELRHQTAFAASALRDLRTALNSMDKAAIMRHAHGVLHHAHTISRLLWPERVSSNARSEWLRKELGIEDTSPLQLRELRRQLEAGDERFEDWLNDLADKNYVDANIMPVAALGTQPGDTFQRSLDPDTLTFHLRGARCDLSALGKALQQLDHAASGWLRSHNPW